MSDHENPPDDDPLGGLAGLLGGGGGGLGGLLEQAQAAMAAQAEVSETVVKGSAGGGIVTIEVTGGGRFLDVSIDPAAVDPDDVETLEDLVLAALRDCNTRIAQLQSDAMGGLGALAGDDPMAALSGMFGDADEEDGESEE